MAECNPDLLLDFKNEYKPISSIAGSYPHDGESFKLIPTWWGKLVQGYSHQKFNFKSLFMTLSFTNKSC